MTAEYTAEVIVNGIRRNQEKVFVPPAAELIVLFKRFRGNYNFISKKQ